MRAACEWCAERGATRLRGPATFTVADEAGVQVDGFEHAGGTGRPWHPPWYVQHLVAAGLTVEDRTFPRWRVAAGGPPPKALHEDASVPPQAGTLADRRLVLTGAAGSIAAVPDVSAGFRGTSLRRARRRLDSVDEAAVVRVDGDPAVLVPALLGAAGIAGYDHLWTPWTPEVRPPDTVHQLLGADL